MTELPGSKVPSCSTGKPLKHYVPFKLDNHHFVASDRCRDLLNDNLLLLRIAGCVHGAVAIVKCDQLLTSNLSWVRVSKSLASWRSCNWVSSGPVTRLTMRPRLAAGRWAILSAQATTWLYSLTCRNSPAS